MYDFARDQAYSQLREAEQGAVAHGEHTLMPVRGMMPPLGQPGSYPLNLYVAYYGGTNWKLHDFTFGRAARTYESDSVAGLFEEFGRIWAYPGGRIRLEFDAGAFGVGGAEPGTILRRDLVNENGVSSREQQAKLYNTTAFMLGLMGFVFPVLFIPAAVLGTWGTVLAIVDDYERGRLELVNLGIHVASLAANIVGMPNMLDDCARTMQGRMLIRATTSNALLGAEAAANTIVAIITISTVVSQMIEITKSKGSTQEKVAAMALLIVEAIATAGFTLLGASYAARGKPALPSRSPRRKPRSVLSEQEMAAAGRSEKPAPSSDPKRQALARRKIDDFLAQIRHARVLPVDEIAALERDLNALYEAWIQGRAYLDEDGFDFIDFITGIHFAGSKVGVHAHVETEATAHSRGDEDDDGDLLNLPPEGQDAAYRMIERIRREAMFRLGVHATQQESRAAWTSPDGRRRLDEFFDTKHHHSPSGDKEMIVDAVDGLREARPGEQGVRQASQFISIRDALGRQDYSLAWRIFEEEVSQLQRRIRGAYTDTLGASMSGEFGEILR